MSTKSLALSERCPPGDPLSEYSFLNDMPKALRQIKKPVEEVKLLLESVKQIFRYLDGLEGRDALDRAEEGIRCCSG
jgi:hypothetical protein